MARTTRSSILEALEVSSVPLLDMQLTSPLPGKVKLYLTTLRANLPFSLMNTHP